MEVEDCVIDGFDAVRKGMVSRCVPANEVLGKDDRLRPGKIRVVGAKQEQIAELNEVLQEYPSGQIAESSVGDQPASLWPDVAIVEESTSGERRRIPDRDRRSDQLALVDFMIDFAGLQQAKVLQASVFSALSLHQHTEFYHAFALWDRLAGAPPFGGLMEQIDEGEHPERLLRLDEPAPGTGFLFAHGMGGQVCRVIRL